MNVPLAWGRQFSLEEASRLLPSVKSVTAEAVRETKEAVTGSCGSTARPTRSTTCSPSSSIVVSRWASRLKELQVEAKGLWLVDFDNGDGYYCWQYPEEAITHYHAYDEGFSGRMKIVLPPACRPSAANTARPRAARGRA